MSERMLHKIENEALMKAAQVLAMSKEYHQTQIFGINQHSKSRMCMENSETVSHVLNIYPKLTTNNYLKRQHDVAAFLHRNMSPLWN